MSCDNCIRLTSGTEIRSADALKKTVDEISLAISDGTLKNVGAGKWGDPFTQIAKGYAWGDFVSNYFSCSRCGQFFHLHAETYHGSGGRFEKVSKIPEELQSDSKST